MNIENNLDELGWFWGRRRQIRISIGRWERSAAGRSKPVQKQNMNL